MDRNPDSWSERSADSFDGDETANDEVDDEAESRASKRRREDEEAGEIAVTRDRAGNCSVGS